MSRFSRFCPLLPRVQGKKPVIRFRRDSESPPVPGTVEPRTGGAPRGVRRARRRLSSSSPEGSASPATVIPAHTIGTSSGGSGGMASSLTPFTAVPSYQTKTPSLTIPLPPAAGSKPVSAKSHCPSPPPEFLPGSQAGVGSHFLHSRMPGFREEGRSKLGKQKWEGQKLKR
jgi:hypothetical protein